MTTTEQEKNPNGQDVAADNELHILYWLHRFGWLRTRDLASLVWYDSRSADSAISMAQRTLKRLKSSRQVLHKIAPDGATVYALALAGAKRLGDEAGIDARSGKDVLRVLGNYEHRCNANVFAINQVRAGEKIWTEREIQSGRAPVRTVLHKVPDGLIDATNDEDKDSFLALSWVEIERGHKKADDFTKMMNFAYTVLGPLNSAGQPTNEMYDVYVKNAGKPVMIQAVIIQVANEAQRDRIIRAVRKARSSRPNDYAWWQILFNLYLCDNQSVELHPIRKWVTD